MASVDCTQRRPSLYAAITLTKLLYTFRDRLRVRIQSKKTQIIKSSTSELDQFQNKAYAQAQMCASSSNIVKVGIDHGHLSSAISRIEAISSGQNMPLRDIARDHRKFLNFDAQKYSCFWTQGQASRILDNTTLLLQYLAILQLDSVARGDAALRNNFCDLDEFDVYLANIEHLARCLQQLSINTLVQNTVNLLASSATHWYKWLDSANNKSGDWYSEWSSGRPPLNSTMPWNIKASLVVLWGVCWMFYMPANMMGSSEGIWPSQNQDSDWSSRTSVSTDAQTISTAAALSSPVGNMHIQQHAADIAPYPSHSSLYTHSGNTGVDQEDLIGQLTRSGYALDGVASMSQNSTGFGHMSETGYGSRFPQQAASNLSIQNYRKTITSSAGIRSPLTSSSTVSPPQGNSELEAQNFVHDPNLWPANQNVSHFEAWSQPSRSRSISASNFYPSSALNSSTPSVANTSPLSNYNPSQELRNLHPSFNTYTNTTGMNLPPPYPLSPNNSAPSERESSVAPITLGGSLNFSTRVTSHDSGEPRGEGRDSQEPPRDAQGNFYCSDPKCVNNPTFTRKCEWRKHRDTHTRPYVCRVPGCEKIQGFTYSGGLLRHQREVHQQHGGPIKRHYCPHADCKRSEDPGFSRKENLTEHLRRVHRGNGSTTIKREPATSPAISNTSLSNSDPSNRRKRRRVTSSEDSSYQLMSPQIESLVQTVTNLRNEIQELRREIGIKDATILHLQGMQGTLAHQAS